MTGDRLEERGWVERWYRVMLLAYPPQYRERHGGELLGTLLEARPSRRRPSLRESVSLLDVGMLTRLRTRLDEVPAWVDGLQLGLFLLVLTQAGMLLGDLSAAPQQPNLAILLPASLLVLVAVLLGRMGIAAVVAVVPAALASYQTLRMPGNGTDYLAGVFSSRMVEVSSDIHALHFAAGSRGSLILVGSVVLAAQRRTRGPLLRRSWWWLTVPLLAAAVHSYGRTLLPTMHAPIHHVPTSFIALSTLPLIATAGFLLLALRATAAIGDPRWAIATGVYLVPVGLYAATLVFAQPSAIVTLDTQLPAILIAVASAVVLLRKTRRRAEK